MKLHEAITSLTATDTIENLSRMLDGAHASISWQGQRLVWVNGYEGSVELSDLVLKYLQSYPFQQHAVLYLKDRLECDVLWGKIVELCKKSNDELKNSCLYKYFVAIKEYKPWSRLYSGDPLLVMKKDHYRKHIFAFTPNEFRQCWDESERKSQLGSRWIATKEMVVSCVDRMPSLQVTSIKPIFVFTKHEKTMDEFYRKKISKTLTRFAVKILISCATVYYFYSLGTKKEDA